MGAVPGLSAFYGIVIYMYRPDYPPSHFHAWYGEHVAQIDLTSLEVSTVRFQRGRFAWAANGQSFIAVSCR